MAAKRSPQQLREIADVVHALYEKSGAVSWAEFARRAEVSSVQMSNWQLGKTEPSGYNLVRLIRAADGVPDPLHVADAILERLDQITADVRGSAGDEENPDTRGGILGRLEELGASVSDLATTVDGVDARLAELVNDGAQPRRAHGRGSR